MLSSILPSEILQIPTDDTDVSTIDEGGLPASKVVDNKPQSLPIAGGQPMNIAAASAWDVSVKIMWNVLFMIPNFI